MNWMKYLDKDFGTVEGDEFHVDGYVYYTEFPKDKPYRLVQICDCYIPLDKRNDTTFISEEERECKQYIEDITEEKAEEYIKWYIRYFEMLSTEVNT